MTQTPHVTFQPDRFKDGYGLHIQSIDSIIQEKATLAITVDCGITAKKASLYANEKKS